jgi:hypothetical protein
MNSEFIVMTRPDGTELHMNRGQVVYVTTDPADETGNKTEVVTTQGAFIIKKPLKDVLQLLSTGGKL